MSSPIVQSVLFGASARKLFDHYVDPALHAAFTGGKVSISTKPGSDFSAFDRMLAGVMLFTIPGRLIVQRWRSTGWKTSDPDSLLVLSFTDEGKKGRIDLVHLGVPSHDHRGVTEGWKKFYWKPLTAFLRAATPGKALRSSRKK